MNDNGKDINVVSNGTNLESYSLKEQSVNLNETLIDLPVELDYEDIKNDPNKMWFKYEDKIKKVTVKLGYWKNFDQNELYQQAYLYFIDFCAMYDPYYQGNFIPFDKFMFRNMIIRLRAFIQSYYFKRKREKPAEIFEYMVGTTKNSAHEAEDRIYTDFLYSIINDDRKEQILKMSFSGWKQQEIGEKLNISQSRVSVIKKKAIKKLKEAAEKHD